MQTPNGILPVDKPAGWTSFDVLAKLRGALGTRKLGHSGTLDPMATGVLAVFIGKATAAADRQLDHDKTYEATIRLGLRSALQTPAVQGRFSVVYWYWKQPAAAGTFLKSIHANFTAFFYSCCMIFWSRSLLLRKVSVLWLRS